MTVVSQVLSGVAILGCAAVYGADLFALLVLGPALSKVDDHALTSIMGNVHQYGDRRMPVPFALGLVAALAAALTAAVASRPVSAAADLLAVLALAGWLAIYGRVSRPLNRRLAEAARDHRDLPEARTLQRSWDSVVPVRLGLQLLAVAALGTAVATA